MPWHIDDDNPDCSGYAVVKDSDGEIEGCHETREDAEKQLAALYAQEGGGSMRQNVEGKSDVLIVRTFEAELAEGDGRTLDVRIVPFDTPARVVDLPEYGGDGIPYMEAWAKGAFDRQLSEAHRVNVFMNIEHEPGFRGVIGIGKGTEMRSADDALYGSFRIFPGDDGDKALSLVHDKVLTGISLEAIPKASREIDGVVHRMRAHLDRVALCRPIAGVGNPAFQRAEVLAVRQASEQETIAVLNPEVDLVLQRLSYDPEVVKRTVVTKPWDGSASRFTDEEYERSCLVCRTGDDPPKTRCSLPVLEPNGDLNVNGMHAAAGRIRQTGISAEEKSKAARKLVRYYRQAKQEPPPALVALASR